ncbi:MAG: efflux transporter outer membrane subunit [Planctomycetota bacterium]
MAKRANRFFIIRPLCFAIVLPIGCAEAPQRQPLPLQDPPLLSALGEDPLIERWWQAFGNPRLNESVEHALGSNFDLVAAWERVQQAKAAVRRERADLFPELDGVGDVQYDRRSGQGEDIEFGLGLQASYEVDLWGRIQSRVEAERLRMEATRQDYRAAAVGLSAEVALAWYTLAEARMQVELAESQVRTNRQLAELVEARFRVGQVRQADLLRQRQLVEATIEELAIATGLAEVASHRLAILVGRPPQTPEVAAAWALNDLPPAPEVGLPSELLQRRPDVVSALLALEASDRDVAAAVRDQYPSVNLSASIRTAAERPERLFEEWVLSLAGQAVTPLVDGGLRRAEVDRSVAQRRELLATYGQVVLNAMGEVEDAVALERSQSREIESLRAQLDLATETTRQLRLQYFNGAIGYIDVLTAIQDQQELERDVLEARLDAVAFRIALYRALAGGFPTPLEPALALEAGDG